MYAAEFSYGFLWWLFPLLMIAFCFFMMRGRKRSFMCGFGSRGEAKPGIQASDSAKDILDKRFALGEINRDEYEEKKQLLNSEN
ncbi:MAG: hypothetical protein JRF72_03620 [Deltaproteobacteria bacterium]|jgi:uncharacterized membrane protein|nr:hypothetical protein [Deltaproteobacteria bacterium]